MLKGRDGRRLPDFLIVGAAKCGTTSLFRYLGQHPDVFVPETKEPNYFAFSAMPSAAGQGVCAYKGKNNIQTYDEYCALFEGAKSSQVVGEASVSYLMLYKQSVERIYEDYEHPEKVKIIIMLRDPVDRLISQYVQHKQAGFEKLDIREAIRPDVIRERLKGGYQISWDYLATGMYAEQVKCYLEKFEQVKVVHFEDFCNYTGEIVRETYRYLGIATDEDVDNYVAYNRSGLSANRAFALINALVFKRNPIKTIAGRLIPRSVKPYILAKVAEKTLRKWRPTDAVVSSLQNYYEEDQKKLQRYLKMLPMGE